MKTFSIAVAVAVMLTFICVQKSSAAPNSEGHDMMEEVAEDSSVAVNQKWIPVESWKIPYEVRQKRHAAAKCRFCCNCCDVSGCGVCCTF
ncbi:hepcidin-like [Melanotaenia boesemani]|uniref:hepcidin-like n=1 Tax=Melanotaenia boesemani TaxID=1250792 RepID=UPI001C053AB6|nr:hepcidin-like [Melanotaenia boesemani]